MTDRPTFALQFGALVATRRQQRGHTLVELGALIGVHKQTVWRWEAGDQLPDAYDLARLARALGCSVRSLLPDAQASSASQV